MIPLLQTPARIAFRQQQGAVLPQNLDAAVTYATPVSPHSLEDGELPDASTGQIPKDAPTRRDAPAGLGGRALEHGPPDTLRVPARARAEDMRGVLADYSEQAAVGHLGYGTRSASLAASPLAGFQLA